MEYGLEIAAILMATAWVMMLHELPKSIMYIITGRHCQKEDKYKIFRIFQYIDPIGLILFLLCHAGASRPYPYRLKERDTNIAIGMTGFLTLAIMIVASVALYNYLLMNYPVFYNVGVDQPLMYVIIKMSWYFMYASIALFIVNLFPIATSDIFLLIVAVAPGKLMKLLKYDSIFKIALLMCMIFNYIQRWAMIGMELIYEFLGFV